MATEEPTHGGLTVPKQESHAKEKKSIHYDINTKDEKEEVPQEQDAEPSADEYKSPMDEMMDRLKAETELVPTIMDEYNRNGTTFEDPNFPPDDSSLYKSAVNLPDYVADGHGVTSWRRPEYIRPKHAVIFTENKPPSDVIPGDLPDHAFVGALAVVSIHPHILGNLFVHVDKWKEVGLVVCRFFKEGDWREVLIDTRIPYCDDVNRGKCPAYAYNDTKEEMWVCLLEKAYAKLHGCYEAVAHRDLGDCLVDLTGGSTEVYDLTTEQMVETRQTGELWVALQTFFLQGCVLACVCESEDDEIDRTDGVMYNTAYAILDVVEVEDLRLIRIRNPWGDTDWKGAFADNDIMWNNYPELKERLGYQFGPDGTWWMRFEDWAEVYNKFYVCRLFPARYSQAVTPSMWHGLAAAGPPRCFTQPKDQPNPNLNATGVTNLNATAATGLSLGATMNTVAGGEPSDAASHMAATVRTARSVADGTVGGDDDAKSTYTAVTGAGTAVTGAGYLKDSPSAPATTDPDPKWFNNPQFRLTLHAKKTTTLFISLCQSEAVAHLPVNFVLISVKNQSRLWECNEADIVGMAVQQGDEKVPRREVTLELAVDPKRSGNSFVLVCYQDSPKIDTTLRHKFFLRLFASEKFALDAFSAPWHRHFKAEWRLESAGGRRHKRTGAENILWARNPQLILNFKKPTVVKIVLERSIKKSRRESQALGLGITRLHSSSEMPKKRGGALLATKATTVKKGAERDKSPLANEPPPEIGRALRKLQILHTDLWQESSYAHEDWACMHLKVTPQQGPLVVVPTLQDPGAIGTFTMRIHADRPLKDAVKLDEATNVVLISQWTAATAGGCHLFHPPYEINPKNQTWKRNPKFLLTVYETIHITITLARLDKPWRKTVAQDNVGAMMAFYVLRGTEIDIRHIEAETPFLPGHENSLELTLDVTDDNVPHTILCCTYQPGKLGDFMLRLSTNHRRFEIEEVT